jgi:signal transduction histidine kinase
MIASASALLITFAAFFGVEIYPYGQPGQWSKIEWTNAAGNYALLASSTAIPTECRSSPDSFINFPIVLQANQKIRLDGRLVLETGGPNSKTAKSMVDQPVLKCSAVKDVRTITWEVVTPTKIFASLQYEPFVTTNYPMTGFMGNLLNLFGCGAALMLAVISFFIFGTNFSNRARFAIFSAAVGSSLYAGAITIGKLGIELPMLGADKVLLVGFWISVLSIFDLYKNQGYINKYIYNIYAIIIGIELILISVAQTTDFAETSTVVLFPLNYILVAHMLFNLFRDKTLKRKTSNYRLLYLACPMILGAGFISDMLGVSGLIITPPILPIWIVVGLTFFMVSLNENINETFLERDYLRLYLETEVERKTAELNSTLQSLLSTQAQLVQNAKLTSIGTLAGGLAHELNNSTNFVKNALRALRVREDSAFRPESKNEVDELLKVMEDGVKITSRVVNSLLSHTGLNQGRITELSVSAVVDDVLTILSSKIGTTSVEVDIPPELTFNASASGFNEMILCLILNSIDAVEGTEGRIKITAREIVYKSWRGIEMTVEDNGCGIDGKILDRIFDPFFTTKDVGKGSGLGLHIVRNEVLRNNGEIHVESQRGSHTRFKISLPGA